MALTSQSKYYYIQLRPALNDPIFRKEGDYQYFLQQLHYKKIEFNLQLIAYCLLPNQIHLILEDSSRHTLIEMLKNLSNRYNRYLSEKYSVDETVLSELISAEPFHQKRELLCRLRYLHQKPKVSGVTETLRYTYSSYNDYLQPHMKSIVYRKDVYQLFDRSDDQKAANLLEVIHHEFEDSYKEEDDLLYTKRVETAKQILKEAINNYDIHYNYFQKSSDLRDYLIIKINKKANLNQEEIAQLLNISRHIVGRVLRHNI